MKYGKQRNTQDLFIRNLPTDLVKRFRRQAKQEERTMKMTTIRAIREYLERHE